MRALSLLLATGCTATPPADPGTAPAIDPLVLRPLHLSADRRIVDDRDREVLLRGVNLTSLGEYWQGSPDHPPTQPTTEADWEELASRGVTVVRLVVHWSRLEPERGLVDEAYLDAVEAMVDAAAARGIYTVVDMHQDAYSASIATGPDEVCPEGAWPGKGWDGAPAWATLTDGLSTCVTGDRNSAPAVKAAWNHFYDDTDGIRGEFVATWGAVAARFAGNPAVAGYDLLNEPETSRPAAELSPLYHQLLGDCVRAIRAAGAAQLVFLEPAIPAGDRSLGLVLADPGKLGLDDPDLVGATHNYAESIEGTGLGLEQTNDLVQGMAETQGTGVWIGEYGFWSTDAETLAVAARYAADEDAWVQGGAWWQWRQPCGDPHSLRYQDGAWVPEDRVVHLHTLDCAAGVEVGPTEDFLRLLGRGHPRAAPGRIGRLESDPETGALLLEAEEAPAGGELVVWTPTGAGTHEVWAEGLADLVAHEVPGGRLLTARVAAAGAYALGVAPR